MDSLKSLSDINFLILISKISQRKYKAWEINEKKDIRREIQERISFFEFKENIHDDWNDLYLLI